MKLAENGRFLTVEHGGRNFMVLCSLYPMADRQALIDWPLTPYTGWGGYSSASPSLA